MFVLALPSLSCEIVACYLIADLATLIKLRVCELSSPPAVCPCMCICERPCVLMLLSGSTSPLLLLLAVFPQAVTLRKQEVCVPVCVCVCVRAICIIPMYYTDGEQSIPATLGCNERERETESDGEGSEKER